MMIQQGRCDAKMMSCALVLRRIFPWAKVKYACRGHHEDTSLALNTRIIAPLRYAPAIGCRGGRWLVFWCLLAPRFAPRSSTIADPSAVWWPNGEVDCAELSVRKIGKVGKYKIDHAPILAAEVVDFTCSLTQKHPPCS